MVKLDTQSPRVTVCGGCAPALTLNFPLPLRAATHQVRPG